MKCCLPFLALIVFLGSRQCLESGVWDNAEHCRKTPEPLCIEDVHRQKRVKVKSLVTLYLFL